MAMPTRRSLEDLFRLTVQQQASDLHLLVGLPPTLRVNKILTTEEDSEIVTANGLANDIRGILPPELHAAYQKDQSVDTSYSLSDGSRFRINVYYEKGNPALAARFIPSTIPTLEDLQAPAVTKVTIEAARDLG